MIFIGVDPGLKGAIAIIDANHIVVHDMPVTGKTVNPVLLGGLMTDFIGGPSQNEVVCVIEDVHSMPGQGVASSFGFGRSKGVVEGVAGANEYRIVYAQPAKWKREMGVTKDKGSSRGEAIRLWPHLADQFKRVMDDGRAESALLAEWGRRNHR